MKTVDVVLKLPQKMVDRIKSTYGHGKCCGMYDDDRITIVEAIVTGNILPPGHGRLIDEREVASLNLCKDISCSECPFNKNGCGIAIYIEGCKSIIEADKEDE